MINEAIATPRYPICMTLNDGTELTVASMECSDQEMLAGFLSSIPLDDRIFFRSDVVNQVVVDSWRRDLAQRISRPVLVWDGSRIVAEAALHLHPSRWNAHLGYLELMVDPAYRGRGIGTWLADHIVESARQLRLRKVVGACADDQVGMAALLTSSGFYKVARLPGFVRDRSGYDHDMVLMVIDLE